MEKVSLYPRRGDVFDRLVHEGAPEGTDLKLASKPYATAQGKPAVVIAFTAMVDGRKVPVQAVTTLANIQAASRALTVAHESD